MEYVLHSERSENFIKYFGEPVEPKQLAQYYIHMSRQTGRTEKLIDAIIAQSNYPYPTDVELVIVVSSFNMKRAIIDRINRKISGPFSGLKRLHFYVAKKCKIPKRDKVIRELSLQGKKVKIFVDNAVIDSMNFRRLKELNEISDVNES